MKSLFIFVILSFFYFNISLAENVYDFLKKEYEYDSTTDIQNIYVNNTHPKKIILVTEVEVMLSRCRDTLDWENRDNVYSINQKVYPQSDSHIKVNINYPSSSKKRCLKLWAKFLDNSGINTDPIKKDKLILIGRLDISNKKNYFKALSRCSVVQIVDLSNSDPEPYKKGKLNESAIFFAESVKNIKYLFYSDNNDEDIKNAQIQYEMYLSKYRNRINKNLIAKDKIFCGLLKRKF